jgi:hypothetical protein
VATFIEKASQSETLDHQLLAEDMLARMEALIAYQPLPSVRQARQRYQELVDLVATPPASDPPENDDPVAVIETLSDLAAETDLPLNVRLRAIADARQAISEQRFAWAAGTDAEAPEEAKKRLIDLEAQLEKAEHACAELEFAPLKRKADEWIAATNRMLNEIRAWKGGKQDSKTLLGLEGRLEEGRRLRVEVAAYSDLDSANQMLAKLQQVLNSGERATNWADNMRALVKIREIERDDKLTAEQKIKRLAVIPEEELCPEVLQRHNALWSKVYEELETEDQKVAAIRMRILRTDK